MNRLENSFYEFGVFRLDTVKRLLLRDGEVVALPPKAFDTLLALVKNSDRIVEKSELMMAIWPDSFVEESNLTQNVSILRKVLGESPNAHRYIVTVPGRSYRFVASIGQLTEQVAELILERHAISQIVAEYEESTSNGEGAKVELNPNYATAHHWYALHLNDVHRFDEAIAEISRALEIDPLSLVINSDVGIIFSSARRYDQAIEYFKKAIEMDVNFPDAHSMLGWTYVRKGMYPEAIAEFEKARALFGSPTSQVDGLIYAYGRWGKRSEALKVLDELKRLSKQHHTQIPWENLLNIHIGLGEHDKAFEVLEKAHQEGSNVKRALDTPYLDPLRSDPRFADLRRRVGLTH